MGVFIRVVLKVGFCKIRTSIRRVIDINRVDSGCLKMGGVYLQRFYSGC